LGPTVDTLTRIQTTSMEQIDYIRVKLRKHGCKTATIIRGCERLDKNSDGRIHFDDVELVISELLGTEHNLSRREYRALMASLSDSPERGDVHYKDLWKVLDPHVRHEQGQENWFDPETNKPMVISHRNLRMSKNLSLGNDVDPESSFRRSRKDIGHARKGSIGEFLADKGTSSSEMVNFQKFVHCLEKYERDSGIKIETTSEGFTIPLGPELQVSLKYKYT
jgi:hypothetical protein